MSDGKDFQAGDVFERLTGPKRGRSVRLVIPSQDYRGRYAVRDVATGRLSYIHVSVLRNEKYFRRKARA